MIHISQIKIEPPFFFLVKFHSKNSNSNSKFRNEAILECFQLPKRVSLTKKEQAKIC